MQCRSAELIERDVRSAVIIAWHEVHIELFSKWRIVLEMETLLKAMILLRYVCNFYSERFSVWCVLVKSKRNIIYAFLHVHCLLISFVNNIFASEINVQEERRALFWELCPALWSAHPLLLHLDLAWVTPSPAVTYYPNRVKFEKF